MGYDGNKKIKGRKRHVFVDTLGLIIAVVVTAAGVGDREGLRTLLNNYFSKGLRRFRQLWVDGGYSGSELKQRVAGLKKTHKIALEVVERLGNGFQVVKRRWVVERTLIACIDLSGNQGKDLRLVIQLSPPFERL